MGILGKNWGGLFRNLTQMRKMQGLLLSD